MPGDLTTLSLLARWAVAWYLLWRIPRLGRTCDATSGSASPGAPRVSVVIPARNEAETLPRLLASLAVQRLRPAEVIVVDDHSTDATADLARRAGATVVSSPDLPSGWTGKTWACWNGARHAAGDVLVFLDADTELRDDFLECVVAVAVAGGGLVSVQPYHRMERGYERASALFNVVSFMGIGASSFHRHARVTGAFGPCLVTSRSDYFAVGGHKAVKGAVLEDVELARAYAAADLPLRCFGGRAAINFRMYAGGVGHMVEGWSKNFAAGAGATPPARTIAIVAWISGLLESGWRAAAGLAGMAGGLAGPRGMVWVLYALFALQLLVMLRPLGNFRATALVYPLPVLAFVAIFCRSVALALRGEVQWKGRTLPVRGLRAEV